VTVEDELRTFIAARGPNPAIELTDEFPLIEQRVLDSLRLYRVVAFIEQRFGVTVADEDLVFENFATIAAIGRLVRCRLTEQPPSGPRPPGPATAMEGVDQR
jgi:acyl carrier protein